MSPNSLRTGTDEAAKHLKLAQGKVYSSFRHENARLEEELMTTPLFSLAACETLNTQRENGNGIEKSEIYPQYGLLGVRIGSADDPPGQEDLVYANVSAPWSAFICGSQGSGKSHTLSCLLENALIKSSPAGKLNSPLAGLVMHYDKFTAFASTQLCEAAYLYSFGIPVRILVSPTNYLAMKAAYTKLAGGSSRLTVEPLYLPQKDLTIGMMKTLMGINNKAEQPLYIEVIMKILRDMAIANQGQAGFNYAAFKRRLREEQFIKGQMMPLNMRLEVLESFFEPGSMSGVPRDPKDMATNIWHFAPGTLTIIDLSCPFVGPEDSCALFNISVSLFLKRRHDAGRIIALDEAHKFMTSTTPEALDLTETLLSIIRQQRHLGARVVIATQEPTLAPALLELCNLTIIHRFSSPAWFKSIKSHIAGAGTGLLDSDDGPPGEIFSKIVRLPTGEALVFCPTALLGIQKLSREQSNESFDIFDLGASSTAPRSCRASDTPDSPWTQVLQLGAGYALIRVRQRFTIDGGRSVLQR